MSIKESLSFSINNLTLSETIISKRMFLMLVLASFPYFIPNIDLNIFGLNSFYSKFNFSSG